ncbi:MAG: hypothetical protein RI885_1288, partial [Actinomycetota bacterium]
LAVGRFDRLSDPVSRLAVGRFDRLSDPVSRPAANAGP